MENRGGERLVHTSIIINSDAGRVELQVDGRFAGYLAFERIGDALLFKEIQTDSTRAGQGLGVVLVRTALDAARADGLVVLPVSAFICDFIRRHPVYLELVPPEQRERFRLPSASAGGAG
jgi:uncharacterized protein